MRQKAAFVCAAVLMFASITAVAQTGRGKRPADPAIIAATRQVSADNLRQLLTKLVSFGTRHTLSAATPEAVKSGRGIGAAREWIRSEFERISKDCGGCLEVKTDDFIEQPAARIPQPTQIVNVYAILRGSDPEAAKRMYVISGHYDTRASEPNDATSDAPGANDDGSGTVAVIESARVLSKSKFPATIIFLAVASEEQGLNGARHFAKMAKEQGWNIEAVLNNDTVGGDNSAGQDFNTIRVFSEGIPINASEAEVKQIRSLGAENDSISRQLARYMRETARAYLPGNFAPQMIFRPDRYLRGGDHTAFNQFGFAAVRLTDWRENYDHQHQNVRTENGIEYGDLLKFVSFDFLANVARLNVATLASLASAPAPPSNVRLDTRQLTNDSTITWQPAPGGLASGYEVVWRATTAPEWEHVESVGNVTSATLKVSKDNVVFGVRSVDAKGHRSLPVLPVPQR